MEVAWQEVPFWLGEEVLKQDCHSTWCWHEGHGVCQRRGSSQDLLLILGEMMNSQDRSSSHGLFQTEGILLLTSTFCYSQLSLICPWVPRPVVSTAVVMFFAPFNLPSEEKLSMAPWKCCFKYFLFVRWYVYVFHLQPLSQWKCLSAVPGSRMALTYHKRSLSISVGQIYAWQPMSNTQRYSQLLGLLSALWVHAAACLAFRAPWMADHHFCMGFWSWRQWRDPSLILVYARRGTCLLAEITC